MERARPRLTALGSSQQDFWGAHLEMYCFGLKGRIMSNKAKEAGNTGVDIQERLLCTPSLPRLTRSRLGSRDNHESGEIDRRLAPNEVNLETEMNGDRRDLERCYNVRPILAQQVSEELHPV